MNFAHENIRGRYLEDIKYYNPMGFPYILKWNC